MKSKPFKILIYIACSMAVVLVLSAGILLYSCRQSCWVADQAEIIDMAPFAGKNLYLVYRVSGFQDKVAFYELYTGKPKFDDCGNPDIQPAFKIDIDDTEGFVKGISIQNNALTVMYTKDKAESVEPIQAKIAFN